MRESVEKAKGKYRMCGKRGYDTKAEADIAIEIINTEDLTDHRKPQRSYYCDDCGKWHLTAIALERFEANQRRKHMVIAKKVESGNMKNYGRKKLKKKFKKK